MSAISGEDFLGGLTVTSLLNVTNINTNTGSAGLDISGYTGKLIVRVKCGGGVSGTVIVPSIKAGADTNVLNANNWVLNATNFSTTADQQTLNVDLRSSAFGSTTSVINKYLYLTWLITGSATANSCLSADVIGQLKYSS